MMIGATPATLTNSGCTTPSEMPAATPSSIALPPASRILKPASAARFWVAAIMWCVPMMVGRWDFMLAPCAMVSLDGMKISLAGIRLVINLYTRRDARLFRIERGASLSDSRRRAATTDLAHSSSAFGTRRTPLYRHQRHDAEQRRRHQVIGRRQRIAGLRDQPGCHKRSEAAEDRHRDTEGEGDADRAGRDRKLLAEHGRQHAAVAPFDQIEEADGEHRSR